MNHLWAPYAIDRFEVFSSIHLNTIVFLVVFNIVLLWLMKKNYNQKTDKFFRYTLGLTLLAADLILILWYLAVGIWDWSYSLPFHLSRIAAFLTAIALLTDNKRLYQFTYFIGLGVAIPSLLTPALIFNFPHLGFFKFFISHGGMATGVLYLTLVKGYRPYFQYLWKSFIALNLMLPFIGVVNWLTGGNYFFLAEKPSGHTLLDYMGSWPWYIISMQFLAVIILFAVYSPYYIKDRRSSKLGSNKEETL